MEWLGVMVWTVLLGVMALTDPWGRKGRLAPRDPSEHLALLVLLGWTGLLGLLGAMDETVSMALTVPLGLLAHREHQASAAQLAQPAKTE